MKASTGDAGATQRLLRALAVMGSGTIVSRVLGFVRVALAAAIIGLGESQADTYAVALMAPTALYILFAGGALNSVLVPQLTKATKNDRDGGVAYTNRITTAFLLILAIVTVVAVLCAPLVTRIYSAPEWRTPEMADHYQAMVLLTAVCLPEVFFYGAFVVLGQILNSRDRFGPMMWAPVASNVIQILSFVVFFALWGASDGSVAFTTAQIWVLGGGYLLGAILQAGVMVYFLRRIGYKFQPRFDLKGTGLGKTFKLAGWALGFVLLNQIALAVVSRLATSATAGGVGAGLTVYNNAYLVYLLPHSLITVSLATAMVTSASRMITDGDTPGATAEVLRTMRLVVTALVPAAALLIALGQPIARLLFGFGAGATEASFVGWTIMAFAVGLVPFTIQHVCLRTYYALERNRDTFFIQLLIVAVQIALSLALVLPFQRPDRVAPMLALALSGAYAVGLLISFHHLRKFLPQLRAGELVRHIVRVAVAVAPGAIAAWFITSRLAGSRVQTFLGLAAGGLVAAGAYLLLARVFHISEITLILARLRKQKPAVLDAEETGGIPIADSRETEPAKGPVNAGTELDRVDEDAEDTDEVLTGEPEAAGEDPDTAEDVHPIRVRAGQVLGGRYQLDQVVVRRAETQTWQATDQLLSRPVIIHLLPPDANDEHLLVAARRAAAATDSRFLRVLDAQPGDQRWAAGAADATGSGDSEEAAAPIGPYIVCEHAPGVSLEHLLAAGPLSALEAAWVVREVADGLAGMHDQGLYHERINPDMIVITATGNVKIVGFLLESELEPHGHPLVPSGSPERIDVVDLGRLLYCALVSRWPGGHAHGMAAAPIDADGHLLTPRQVRAGVSPALDTICDRILSPVPRQRETQLRTAHDVVRALSQVLGTANAAQDLERRLRYPVPVVAMAGDPGIPDFLDPTGLDTAAGLPPVPFADPDAPTGRIATVSPLAEDSTRAQAPVHAATPDEFDDYDADPTVRPDPPRRWMLGLMVLTFLVLLGGLVAVALTRDPVSSAAQQQTSPQPLAIKDAIDFDPQGDTREENPKQVPLAHDGDPGTAWTTVDYRRANLSGKDGVGIVFDLGEVHEVARAELELVGVGSAVELRVPAKEAETITTPPLNSIDQWTSVARADHAGAQVTLTPQQPVRTRYLLVMFTELPAAGQNFRGGIAEAAFWSR